MATAALPSMGQREVLDNAIAYGDAAERMGYDAIWILEHHFTRFGLCPSALTMAAFILGRTRRLKVGTAITVLPLDHPVRIAEKVALLDQMSGGRLYFGMGRGSFVKDFEVFQADMAHNHEVMAEWTDIMMAAWSTGRCAGTGERLRFPEVEVYPEPFTKPHPPIYVACSSPTSVEWAARRGFPMLLEHAMEDERKVSQLELYAELASEAGHDPDTIDHVLTLLTPATNDPALIDRGRANLTWWVDEFHRASKLFEPEAKKNLPNYDLWHRRHEESVLKGEWTAAHRVENMLRLNPYCPIDECIAKIQRSIDMTKLRHVVCGFEMLGDRSLVLDAMARFREEVIPRIRPPR